MNEFENVFKVYRIRRCAVAPKCGLPCSKPVDPKRHVGRICVKGRIFECFACPTFGCSQIVERPERRAAATEFDADREMLAIEILAQIIEGRRPWRDLAEVERLMPYAVD